MCFSFIVSLTNVKMKPIYKRIARGAASLLAAPAYEVGKYAVERAANRTVAAGRRLVDRYLPARPSLQRRAGKTMRRMARPTVRRVTAPMSSLRRRLNVGRRNYGAAHSKSGGFIKGGRRVKYRTTKQVSNNLGTVEVIEKGGVIDAGISSSSAGNTVAVGHCNMPTQLAHKVFWRAIVKKLLISMKMDVSDFEAVLQQLYTGDRFRVTYRVSADSAVGSTDYTLLGTSGGVTTDTPESVSSAFLSLFSASADLQDLEFTQFEYIPFSSLTVIKVNMAGCIIDLRNATFTFFAKSSLKVQNRSVSSTNTDDNAVDNVPLYGKTYGGRGSGTSSITRDSAYSVASYGFWCDDTTGTLAKVPTEKWFQEVPQPNHFRHVSYSGKIHLDPGHIKTSVLDGKVTISLNKVYKLLFNQPSGSTRAHEKAVLGKFRFMMLEKMINSVGGTAANSIKLAFENNIRAGGYITTKRSYGTAQLNNVSNITTEA